MSLLGTVSGPLSSYASTGVTQQLGQGNLGLGYAQLGQQGQQFEQDLALRKLLGEGQLGLGQAQLGQQAYQFGQTFPESQRQFDISSLLNQLNAQNQLGLGYASLGPSYLNSILNMLNSV